MRTLMSSSRYFRKRWRPATKNEFRGNAKSQDLNAETDGRKTGMSARARTHRPIRLFRSSRDNTPYRAHGFGYYYSCLTTTIIMNFFLNIFTEKQIGRDKKKNFIIITRVTAVDRARAN